MAQATSISLSKFTASVQAAVKAAVAKHPKFKVEVPNAITFAYMIRGIPVSDSIASIVTMAETQAFATDIATNIGSAFPEALASTARPSSGGAVLSIGGHVIVGIPPVTQIVQMEK